MLFVPSQNWPLGIHSSLLTMKFAVQSGGKEVLHFQLSPSGQNKII